MSVLRPQLLAALFVSVSLAGAPGCTTTTTSSGDIPLGSECTDNSECIAGAACDPKSSVCVAANGSMDVAVGGTCVDDAECASGACSDTGICATDTSGGAGNQQTGQPCFLDDDCLSGMCDIHTDLCN